MGSDNFQALPISMGSVVGLGPPILICCAVAVVVHNCKVMEKHYIQPHIGSRTLLPGILHPTLTKQQNLGWAASRCSPFQHFFFQNLPCWMRVQGSVSWLCLCNIGASLSESHTTLQRHVCRHLWSYCVLNRYKWRLLQVQCWLPKANCGLHSYFNVRLLIMVQNMDGCWR